MKSNVSFRPSCNSEAEKSLGVTSPPDSEMSQLLCKLFYLTLFGSVLLLCSLVLLQSPTSFGFIVGYKFLKPHPGLFILKTTLAVMQTHSCVSLVCLRRPQLTCCCFSLSSDLLCAKSSIRLLNSSRLRVSRSSTWSNSAFFFRSRVLCRVFTPASRTLLEDLEVFFDE